MVYTTTGCSQSGLPNPQVHELARAIGCGLLMRLPLIAMVRVTVDTRMTSTQTHGRCSPYNYYVTIKVHLH